MFDFAAIVSFGGILLWSNCVLSAKHLQYVNEFIKKALIECSALSVQPYISTDQSQSIQWVVDSKKKLLFIVPVSCLVIYRFPMLISLILLVALLILISLQG